MRGGNLRLLPRSHLSMDDNVLGWMRKNRPVFFLFSGKEETVKGFMSLLLSCSVWLLCVAGGLSPHTVRRSLSNSSQPAGFFPTTFQELPVLDSLSAGTGAPTLRRGNWRSWSHHVRGAGLHRKKSSISAWGLTITRTAFADGGGGGVG